MKYENILPAVFLSRPNRFIAHVELDGQEVICHVKNTGRCRELLRPGTRVWVQYCPTPGRKTAYDLIAVEKNGVVINIDSAAPNTVFGEWLRAGGLGNAEEIRPESTHGDSRFDFAFTLDGRPCFAEVKGCTLEEGGAARFPDAPTERGVKHLRGLIRAVSEGYGAYAVFVIQMRRVSRFEPNWATHPAFGEALQAARDAGVQLLALCCEVTPDSLQIAEPVEIRLQQPFCEAPV